VIVLVWALVTLIWTLDVLIRTLAILIDPIRITPYRALVILTTPGWTLLSLIIRELSRAITGWADMKLETFTSHHSHTPRSIK
jgi:hypothetical protein